MPDSLLFYAYFVLWVKGRAEADKVTWTLFYSQDMAGICKVYFIHILVV